MKTGKKKGQASEEATKPERPVDVAGLLELDGEMLRRGIEESVQHVDAVRKALPRVVALNADERKFGIGRLASTDVAELRALLDLVDAQPEVFASLAARDRGADPGVVETGPTRKALDLLEALFPLLDGLSELRTELGDMRLRVGTEVRTVTTAMRAIAHANAPHNDAIRAGLAKVAARRKDKLVRGKGKGKHKGTPAEG